MKLSRALAVAAVAASALSIATVTHAADITRTYDVTATGFTDGNNDLAPYSTFSGSYTVTFDPSMDTATTTNGLTVNYNSLPYSSEFAYATSDDDLTIGSNVIDGNSFYDTPNSYGLFIYNASGAMPASDDVTYTTANGEIFNSSIQTVTLASAVPEPSTWLLMIAGIGGIGLMLRHARTSMGFPLKDAFNV